MSEMSEAIYNSKQALPNKLIKEDGTVTDFAGNSTIGAVDAYENKPALPNKWLNPDGSYSTLNEIVASMIDNDIFVIVDELPATGETDKIYLLATDNKLIEYLWVNDAWDPVGMVEFDIDNYYTKSEITQLISASLDSAKEYADTNFLKKTNTTAYTPTADYHPATKKYVDSSISDIPAEIYYWSGGATQADLELWNTMLEVNKTKMIVLFIYLSNGSERFMKMFNVNDIPSKNTHYTFEYTTNKLVDTTDNSVSKLRKRAYTITTTKRNGVITNVSGVTSWDTANPDVPFLSTNTNYATPYTPLYNGSPATKKYVDDAITTNITNVLSGSY